LQNAIGNANQTVGGDYASQGQVSFTVRSVGLIRGGVDPVNKVFKYDAPRAANYLRQEEQRRVRDLRGLVITSINNQPIRVEDVVEGGRGSPGESVAEQGVVVSNQTRLGRVAYYRPLRERKPGSAETLADVGEDDSDVVECIVLLRKGEETLPALRDLRAKVKALNDPSYGRLLPGVQIETYYDRSELLSVTTETVTENLIVGVVLVTLILLLFIGDGYTAIGLGAGLAVLLGLLHFGNAGLAALIGLGLVGVLLYKFVANEGNVRTALIVAVNIPLALMFAFAVLFLRGKSANLLSIGAVDFGIIVDSTVILVENVYRHISSGDQADLPLRERIYNAIKEIDKALLFSTLIMVCAFVPLFAMTGPEGQLFGPMAQTYACSLGGALLLALTLSPVLCLLFFRKMKPTPENFILRAMKSGYLKQLERCLRYRGVTVGIMSILAIATACMLPWVGTEFMPELEEGNLWIRGTLPLNVTLERTAENSKTARAIIASYPEVQSIVAQLGRPDDGTDTAGFYNSEYFVPLQPEDKWPAVVERTGWQRTLFGAKRPRTKDELVDQMNAELKKKLPGVVWNFSQNIRDNVMEALSGVKGDNSVKIVGPELDELEKTAAKVKNVLQGIRGIADVGIFHIRGQSHLAFGPDPQKCSRWGVTAADVNNVVASALGAKASSSMVEGEKLFDISIRWPKWRRNSEAAILDVPVDIINNQVVLSQGPNVVPAASGNGQTGPNISGSPADTRNPISSTPRLRLRDLVSPLSEDGSYDAEGSLERPGAADIYREDGQRIIAVKFSVRDRDLGGAVAEAQAKTKDLFQTPYRAVWSGEFEQMQAAMGRLMIIVPLALGLIFCLLYLAFHSFADVFAVLSNVIALSMGGVWALLLTGTNFSISAAVGFISIFGVAIMDGLLLISYFNHLRAHGAPLRDAIMQGAEKRVRPVMMTALTAIFGLLPAAVSTRIGSQTQRPLAIVVVGGMITTLLLTRYLMPVLYSFYGHREPPAGSGDMAH
jgi:cobalt-zinc-cadmium resistance protein CzcA